MNNVVAQLFAKLGIDFDEKGFQKADAWMTGLKVALVGLATHKAWGFLKGSLNEITEGADKAVKMSQKFGIGIEELQELGYAADQSGSSIDGVATGLRNLSRNLENSKKGGGEFSKALSKLGIKASSLKKETLDQNLEEIAEGFAKLEDGPKKAKIAMDIFGRSGVELIPLLNSGKEGIVELRNEARELGIVVGGESAKAMEAFKDDQDRVAASIKGIKTQIVVALIPALSDILKGMLAWIKANRQWLKQKIEKMLRLMIKALILLAKTAIIVADALDWLGKRMGLVALAVATLTTAFLILKAAAIKAAIKAAIAWTAAMAPVVLWGLLIAGILLIVEDLFHAFTGGESVFRELYEQAKIWIGDKLFKLLKGAKILVQQFLGMETDDEKEIRQMNERDDASAKGRRAFRVMNEGRDRIAQTNAFAEDFFRKNFLGSKKGEGGLSNLKYLARGFDAQTINPNLARFFPKTQGSVQMSPNTIINVNVPAGTDANGVGKSVRKEVETVFGEMLRTAQSGTGTGGTP